MRFAWRNTLGMVLAAGLLAAGARGQINPHTNITWPLDCASGGGMVYNVLLNDCVAAGINWRGLWDPAVTYAANDAVSYLGAGYISTAGSNTGIAPPAAPWTAFVQSVFNGGTVANAITAPGFVATVAPPAGSFHVAGCCDSLTQGVGTAQGGGYPAQLSADLGIQVENQGSCGQTALQAALRLGALPTTVTVVGGSIPTSGNVQVIFSPASPVDSCNGPSVVSTITGAGGVIASGTLSEISGLDYFAASNLAAPLTVAPGSTWAPVIGETYLGYLVIWAGRNGICRGDNLSSIAAIAAMAVDKKKTLVLSVENIDTPTEYIGGSDYTNCIMPMNAALQATYSGTVTYPDNYFDIRGWLVSQYDPSNQQDVIDHSHDVPPSHLRPLKSSTFLGAVTTTSQTSVLVSTTDLSTIITASGEKMEIVPPCTGTVSPFTCTVTRAYAGTTASTYLSGDPIQYIEPLHFNRGGYTLVETPVKNWILAHATEVPNKAGLYDLAHEGTGGTALVLNGLSTAPLAADFNALTTWPYVVYGDGTTANRPGNSGTWFVVPIGLACCTGQYAAQQATNLITAAQEARTMNAGVWGPWVAALSVGSLTGVGPVTADLNAQSTWPWTGWADNTTLNTPGTGSWIVGNVGQGCCAGYDGQMAIGLTTGISWTRADNNGVWSPWVRPPTVPGTTVVGNIPAFGNTTGDLTGTPYGPGNQIPASIAPGTVAPAPPYTYDTCTAATCANQSGNIAAQQMVASVPGSHGVVYSFKGVIAQTSLGTACTVSSVQLQLIWTNLATGVNASRAVSVQTVTAPAPNNTAVMALPAGTLAIARFNYEFTAQSGTAISFSTGGYTATNCSPNWAYTVYPLLVADYQLQ